MARRAHRKSFGDVPAAGYHVEVEGVHQKTVTLTTRGDILTKLDVEAICKAIKGRVKSKTDKVVTFITHVKLTTSKIVHLMHKAIRPQLAKLNGVSEGEVDNVVPLKGHSRRAPQGTNPLPAAG